MQKDANNTNNANNAQTCSELGFPTCIH